jgi:hypothetical protein
MSGLGQIGDGRDINAARNIKAFALIKYASTAGSAETHTLRESGLVGG